MLVVDDDERVRTVVAWQLEADCVSVLHADAAERPGPDPDAHPDIVVPDLSMPGVGGLDVLCRVRVDADDPALPVIVVSGRSDVGRELPRRATPGEFEGEHRRWPRVVDGCVEVIVRRSAQVGASPAGRG